MTDADLNYVGSISIDPALLRAADIGEYELVTVLDINNGERFDTYAMVGQPGQISLNGAAARRVQIDDLVILLTWVDLEPAEVAAHRPRVVFVDERNRPLEGRSPELSAAGRAP